MQDYHIHTKLCGHATGEMHEYVEAAIARGLDEMGFADHLPFIPRRVPGLTMHPNQLPGYVKEVQNLQDKYPEIRIKLGIEADFLPGYEEQTAEMLEPYPFDYIIGSIHFIGSWGFDDPRQTDEWKRRHIDEVYHEYYKLLRQSARTGLFDIIGHCDLVKKWGHRPAVDLSDEIERTADVFAETGVAIELNTSGLRKPVEEMYPAFDILSIYSKYNIPLMINSDAHDPSEVAADFDLALDWAGELGYTGLARYEQRLRIEELPLPQKMPV
jgi:histidinol-phosphatase (PHP family)